jgi:threonyl-tRNA synthetase
MIHRALVGSLERFIGILIEHYGGKFPFWLAPVQAVVATVTEGLDHYAKGILSTLQNAGFRANIDLENEKITYKIRQYSVKKIPAIIIIGKKEESEKTASIRALGSNETQTINAQEVAEYFRTLNDEPNSFGAR